jgi:hypothetical protein
MKNFANKVVRKTKRHILCSVTFFFFRKILPFMRENAEKCGGAREAAAGNMVARCMLDK